jgi:cytoskeletal protein CcmA (bactofilin family)
MSSQLEAVIGKDLKFEGREVKIVSKGKVRVDCEFEGDVTGTEVVVSERGKLKGNVVGERVIVLGKVVGDIEGGAISLLSSAHVEGNIRHSSLTIETGAEFAGRSRLSNANGLISRARS